MAEERATIHLAPHFNYRPVGAEDQRTCTRTAFELIEQYLEACRQDGGYHLLLPQTDCLRSFYAAYSQHREFVQQIIASGRLETGGSYNHPGEMCLQGEAIVRNLLYGRLFEEAMLGAQPTVYLPLSVFGHCLQLPQLAAKSGFQALVWSKAIAGAPPLCYALSPDGTALPQKREPSDYHPDTLQELLDTVANGLEHQAQLGLRHDLRLLGGDMTAPPPWLTGHSRELTGRDPVILLSTPRHYLECVRPEVQLRSAIIPALGRDFGWYHMGTLITRADLKIANRLAENRILSAEKWATFAALVGARYPDLALDKAWRQILFCQHHDAISGTCADVPYLDLLSCYREALDLAAGVEGRALEYTARLVDTAKPRGARPGGAALVVFNSLSWTRSDICRARVALDDALSPGFTLTDAAGKEVPCQMIDRAGNAGEPWVEIAFLATGVPSLGYRTYYLRPAQQLPPEAETAEPDEPAIENEYVSVHADAAAGGGLTSIYDKHARKELLHPQAGPANELVALTEQPNRELAAWELHTTGEMIRSSARPASVSVSRGPVFDQLRVTTELPERCGVVQEITLYKELPRIDLRTTLSEYRGEHEVLALAFPLAISGGTPTFEDRFAAVVRKRSRARFDFRTLEGRNPSGCGLGAAQNWVDVGPTAALHVMSGRRRVGSVPLGPCAIISPRDLKHRAAIRSVQRALLSRGVTCTHWLESDDPETDTENCAFRISLGGDNAYSQKVLSAHPEASAKLADALAGRPWGGVLVSRPDPQGQSPDVPVLVADTSDPKGMPHLAEALAADIQADSMQISESCDLSGVSEPCDDHGVALINRGSLAASLEQDGTLVSLLFHTAPWNAMPWGEGKLSRFFVPEHKTHVFEHSLLSHQGDWRRGGVVRAGHEVNNPLIASQTPLSSGSLPAELGLVSIDVPNLVIAAVKPLGNPLAEHHDSQCSDPGRGIVLRAYEAEGKPTQATLRFAAEPQEAWLANLMEKRTAEAAITRPGWRRSAEVPLDVPGCGIVTLGSRLAPLAGQPRPSARGDSAEELGPCAQLSRATHCRYWDHNLGAAPIGNQPVTVWTAGDLPLGQNTRFSLGVSNDSRDREISGTVEVIAPSEWTLIPRQIPFRIPAASQAVFEVMVIVPADASPQFLRAVLRDGERELQDVLPIGEIRPLEATLTRGDDGYVVRLVNPNPDYVEGQLALITPVESWGQSVDSLALSSVTPRLHSFRLDAGEESTFAFAVRGCAEGLWAVAKLMWYGRVQYVQEPGAS